MGTFCRLFFFLSFGASSSFSSMGSGSTWLGSPADSLDPTSICFFLRCLALSSVGGGVSVVLEAAACSDEPRFFLRGALSATGGSDSCQHSISDASDAQHGALPRLSAVVGDIGELSRDLQRRGEMG